MHEIISNCNMCMNIRFYIYFGYNIFGILIKVRKIGNKTYSMTKMLDSYIKESNYMNVYTSHINK